MRKYWLDRIEAESVPEKGLHIGNDPVKLAWFFISYTKLLFDGLHPQGRKDDCSDDVDQKDDLYHRFFHYIHTTIVLLQIFYQLINRSNLFIYMCICEWVNIANSLDFINNSRVNTL